MKPKVFIGSSTQGLKIAETVQKELSHYAEAILWSQGLFSAKDVPIESLMAAVESFDFAIFVLLPEDPVTIRGADFVSVRDNVLFELGLFLGKLGRKRNFFVAPKSLTIKDLHLPSDLSGITPATFDPDATNLQAAIGSALFEMKQSIQALGAVILYKSSGSSNPYDFAHRDTVIYKDGKAASPRGKSELKFSPGGALQLERLNKEGRSRIELRPAGSQISIAKKFAPPQRKFRVRCDVRVDAGEHEVRFIFRHVGADESTEKKLSIATPEWKPLELHFVVPPTIDFLFRIEDRAPSTVPSSLYIRNIEIAEEA